MLSFDIKKRIEEEVMSAAADYKNNNGLSNIFLDPLIGYASAEDPLFLCFFERGWTNHPKEIYRPGKTVIVHFLPFAPHIPESNRSGKEVSKEWKAAYDASIIFSAIISDIIKETLEKYGRLASLTNRPSDWNDERNGPNWSHKLAAYVAGMGSFGIAGSFNTSAGSAGRFGSIITEYTIEPSNQNNAPHCGEPNLIIEDILNSCMFDVSKDVNVCTEKINVCPAGAIASEGVNLSKCRAFCAAQKQIVPSADVCGKCFD